MKQILTAFVFLLLLGFGASAQWMRTHSLYHINETELIDSAQYYNTGLLIDSIVDFAPMGDDFMLSYKQVFEYDANEHLAVRTSFIYQSNAWVYNDRIYETRDASNTLLERTWQYYQSEQWNNISHQIYTYDTNGFVTNETTESWIGGQWEATSQTDYVNNINGHVTDAISYYYEGAWLPESSSNYTYNTDGLLVLMERVDTESNPLYNNEYTYDADGLLTYSVYNEWAPQYNTWLYTDRFYSYDGNDNLIHEESGSLQYDAGNTVYIEGSVIDHFYEFVVVDVSEWDNASNIILFPNPATGSVNLSIDYDNSLVSIYDAVGKLVHQQTTSKGIRQLEIDQLPAGTYTISVRSKAELRSARLIVR